MIELKIKKKKNIILLWDFSSIFFNIFFMFFFPLFFPIFFIEYNQICWFYISTVFHMSHDFFSKWSDRKLFFPPRYIFLSEMEKQKFQVFKIIGISINHSIFLHKGYIHFIFCNHFYLIFGSKYPTTNYVFRI